MATGVVIMCRIFPYGNCADNDANGRIRSNQRMASTLKRSANLWIRTTKGRCCEKHCIDEMSLMSEKDKKLV